MLITQAPHLPGRASSQGVCMRLELLAQRPALAEQLPYPGHLSPRLLCLLVLPRPQREQLPGLLGAPNQHEGLSPFFVIQRPLDEGSPPLDELLLAARPNRPLAGAVGPTCHLHLWSSLRSSTVSMMPPAEARCELPRSRYGVVRRILLPGTWVNDPINQRMSNARKVPSEHQLRPPAEEFPTRPCPSR